MYHNVPGSNLRKVLLFVACVAAVGGVSEGWGDVAAQLGGSVEEFRSLVEPLANMSALAYVTTAGSYYDEKRVNSTVAEFMRDDELSVDREEGGMRARVFVDKKTSRVAVAYRGTDLGRVSRGGQADICFDSMMSLEENLPNFCSQFTDEELDYYGQATEVLQKTMKKYPNMNILLTGHSLGCALTGILAVSFQSQNVSGVCFALPGVLDYASKRTGVAVEDIKALDNLHSLTDSKDPLTLQAVIADKNFGYLYSWPPQERKGCTSCCCSLKQHVSFGISSLPGCRKCFNTAHNFANYMHHLVANDTVKATRIEEPSSLVFCKDCPQKKTPMRNGANGGETRNAQDQVQKSSLGEASAIEEEEEEIEIGGNSIPVSTLGEVQGLDEQELPVEQSSKASRSSKIAVIVMILAALGGIMVTTALYCKRRQKDNPTSRIRYLELEETVRL